jgi:hypothetical protein
MTGARAVKQRVRIVFGGCVRCHGKLLVLEKAMPADDPDEGHGWQVISGRCAGACVPTPAGAADV